MKIAVCMSGHFRDYDQKVDSLFNNVIKSHECDFFIHSWTNLGFSFNGLDSEGFKKYGFNRNSPDLDQQDVINRFHPVRYKFEVYEEFEPDFIEEAKYYTRLNPWDPPTGDRLISQKKKIYLCDLLRRDYEQQNNFRYDVVIRLRPDIAFNRSIDIAQYDLSSLHMPTEYGYNIASDIFCFGNSDLMTQYSDLYINLRHLYDTTGVKFNPHELLREYLQTNRINFQQHEFGLVLR